MAKKRELARRLHQLDTQVAVYARAVDRLTHRVEELERRLWQPDSTCNHIPDPYISFDGDNWVWKRAAEFYKIDAD